jgi:hypothetical protein
VSTSTNLVLTVTFWRIGHLIELLDMHKDGIAVAEYWTELPPKKELEDRLQSILREARERMARRGLPILEADTDDADDDEM